MKLTFENGKFRFYDGDKFVAINPKSAKAHENIADAKAKKILCRLFVKNYSWPSWAALPDYLDPHQIEGVKWILTRSRSYLAHAPGAGKTCEAIVAAMFPNGNEGRIISIVPPSLTKNWYREIEKWTDKLNIRFGSVTVATVPESIDQKEMDWDAHWIIVPDSMLTRPWVLDNLSKIKKKFVVVDEASRFKDPTAQRTIALFGGTLNDGRKSPGLIYDSPYAVLLDGSPMPNKSMELWAPTFAMSPESIDFMSMQDFGFKYCGAKQNDFGKWEFKGNSNSDELKATLQKTFMHVVREEELNHPERLRSILVMNKDVRTIEHKEWEKKNLSKIKFDDISEDMSLGDLARFRRWLGLRKVNWIADYVKERLEEKNESILLFCWHREVAFELESKLRKYRPLVVIGGTPDRAREKGFEEFQAGKIKLIIGNISAMGRGFNLQRGDRTIFAEFSWCDETNKQAEKRAARKGRDENKPVRCEYVVAPHSMDEIILQAVMRKQDAVKKVIG